jgi:MerR family copper efflux transcriptional regulator
MKEKPLLIGRLARLVGVKPDTIRFYERSGLLPKPQRMASGYRVYDDSALKQVCFIRRAQSLGFSLDQIHRILSLRSQGKETCRCVVAMSEATLAKTEAKLKELQEFRDALARNLERWKRVPRGRLVAKFCALIESSGRGELRLVRTRSATSERWRAALAKQTP